MSALDVDAINEAARCIREGGVVCFPTESTYGLAVDIRIPSALERLVKLKGRDPKSPFGLIVSSVDDAKMLSSDWPPRADELANMHWPGPLTIVVPALKTLASMLVGEQGGVGIRCSSHPIASELVQRVGAPITATSANLSGEPNATRIEEARARLGDGVDVYLDGGVCDEKPSTLVLVNQSDCQVLRPGPIDLSA